MTSPSKRGSVTPNGTHVLSLGDRDAGAEISLRLTSQREAALPVSCWQEVSTRPLLGLTLCLLRAPPPLGSSCPGWGPTCSSWNGISEGGITASFYLGSSVQGSGTIWTAQWPTVSLRGSLSYGKAGHCDKSSGPVSFCGAGSPRLEAPSLLGSLPRFSLAVEEYARPQGAMYSGDGIWLLFFRVCLCVGSGGALAPYTLVTSRLL